jgi:glutamate/tyrosine decarboxylase-like PLP-dependent enzyme
LRTPFPYAIPAPRLICIAHPFSLLAAEVVISALNQFEGIQRYGPQFGTVVFRYIPRRPGLDADEINASIRRHLFESGSAVTGRTRVRGQPCLKFTCINPATSEAQMNELIEAVVAQGKELEQA